MKSSEILTQLKRIADALEKLSAKQSSDPIKDDVYQHGILSLAQFGKVDAVKELISKGVDVNFQCPHNGFTALHYAAQNNHLSTVEALVACDGVDINIKEVTGWTPLMVAALWGHKEIVKCLCAHPNIDLHATNNDGRNAAWVAASLTQTHVFDVLRCAGLDVAAAVKWHMTDLLIAGAKDGQINVVKKAIEVGTDVNAKNDDGETALMHAQWNNYQDIIELLKESGAV